MRTTPLDVALPGIDEDLSPDVPLPFGQLEELTPEEETRRLRRALVDALEVLETGKAAPAWRVRSWRELAGRPAVVDQPATPDDRRDEGIARAAAKWTDDEVAQVDAAIATVARRHRTAYLEWLLEQRPEDEEPWPYPNTPTPADLTTADVWAELGAGFPVTKGIAGRMIAARSAGLIENTGRTTYPPKDAPGPNNGQRLTVWRAR